MFGKLTNKITFAVCVMVMPENALNEQDCSVFPIHIVSVDWLQASLASLLRMCNTFRVKSSAHCVIPWHSLVSLNRLSVGCGTTPRRQPGESPGFCLFIRVIYTMLPPHGHWLILFFFINNCKFVFLFILC